MANNNSSSHHVLQLIVWFLYKDKVISFCSQQNYVARDISSM